MQKLKRIGAISLANTLALIYIVLGLIWAIVTIIAMNVTAITIPVDPTVASLGYWIILVFPIVYAIVGWIMGAVIALLYNLVAKKTGGIALDFGK